MFSLAEYERMDNDIVVEKLLVVVHQAISDEFPNAAGPSQQFKKTVFSSESTVMNPAPAEAKNQDSSDSPYADIPKAEESNFKSSFDNSEFPSNVSDPGDQMHSSFEQGIETVTNSSMDQINPRRNSVAKKLPVAGIALFVAFISLVLVGIYLALA